MKGFRLILLTTLFGVLFEYVNGVEILSSNKDICRYFKDGVKLRQPGSCTNGIVCQNFKSVLNVECDSKQYYDVNTMKCAKSTTDTYCSSPCTTKTFGFVGDKKSCRGWFKCDGKTLITYGYCESGLVFNADSQICDYSDKYSCEATYDICDVVPNFTPFQFENDDCGTYNECVKGKIAVKYCDYGNYFDINTGKCISRGLVDCKKPPYPANVCGTTKLALRDRFVKDGATCRGYFYCKDLGVGKPDASPQWGQCPPTTFFEPTEMACMGCSYVKCIEDRCDGQTDGYQLSQTIGCRNYLVCKNNRTVSEEYCGDNMWFDIVSEKCTSTKKSYPACT